MKLINWHRNPILNWFYALTMGGWMVLYSKEDIKYMKLKKEAGIE